jgi:hypothetical protein
MNVFNINHKVKLICLRATQRSQTLSRLKKVLANACMTTLFYIMTSIANLIQLHHVITKRFAFSYK